MLVLLENGEIGADLLLPFEWVGGRVRWFMGGNNSRKLTNTNQPFRIYRSPSNSPIPTDTLSTDQSDIPIPPHVLWGGGKVLGV
jgi:hypothetical protein